MVVKELKVDFSVRRKTNYIVQGGEKYMPGGDGTGPVSYTHLDVYKRQDIGFTNACWLH